jgi:N6-adenosine-specific RNA methylase IME4
MTVFNSGKKYSIIYADPPWSFNDKRTGGSMKSGASQHYDVMYAGDICRFPVWDISECNSILFMWWIASMPLDAIYVATSWGFTVKTMTGFVWNKTYEKSGKPYFGMGHWTRAGSECCLIATRGKIKPVSHSVRSVVTAPVLKHSQKPLDVADRIVELCGDLPRIELFARDRKPGWDCWGNEV